MKKYDSRYFSAFWGLKPEQIKATIIVSPNIYPQRFAKIIDEKFSPKKSIWGNLVANFKNFTYVKTPMLQSAVADLIALLPKTKCRKLVFLGAIGALSKGIKIGDVIMTDKARQIFSVKSAHEETKEKMLALRKKGILGVDFESRAFFAAAKKIKLPARAYYVVTDLPLTKPFYQKRTKVEKERIQAAVDRAVRQIYSHTNQKSSRH
jgi:purine-nucleoside phosphorylase